MSLEMNEYQRRASMTAIYKDKIVYPTLGLVGEAGEVAEKVKKLMRDGDGVENISEEKRQELLLEISDVMWYIAALCTDLKAPMHQVAQMNLDKLESRQKRGVINGSGDNR